MTAIFALCPDGDRHVWPIEKCWLSYNGLWGGALLGTAIASLERLVEKPIRTLNAQFVSAVRHGGTLVAASEVRVLGRNTVQAAVDIHFEESRVFAATAVLGLVPDDLATSARLPDVPPPGPSPLLVWPNQIPGGIQESMETRVAAVSDERVALWTRCLVAKGRPLSSAIVAALADHPAFAATLATNERAFGITLDSCLHFLAEPDAPGDDWVLLDIGFDAIARNMAVASANVWCGAQLVAQCRQTLALRAKQDRPPS